MKKQIILLILAAFAATQFWGCDDDENIFGQIKGSGDIVAVDYSFDNFARLDVSNAFHVSIVRSDTFYVQLQVDDNLVKYLEVSKSSQWLNIGMDSHHNYNNAHLEAVVHMPAVERIKGSGATHFELDNFETGNGFELGLSGASEFSGVLHADDCNIQLSGASQINLKGSCNSLTFEASGASDLNMGDFVIGNAQFILSGASDGTINVTGRLDAILSGASVLRYYGNPEMGNINISGASSLIKL